MTNCLADKLQIWGFSGDEVLFGDASLGAGFRFEGIDISCKEDEDVNQLKNRVSAFLNALPTGLDLQVVQKITGGNDQLLAEHAGLSYAISKANANDFAKTLLDYRIKRWQRQDELGKLPKFEMYFFLRKSHVKQQKARIWPGKLQEKPRTVNQQELQEHQLVFQRIVKDFEANAQTLGIKLKRLQQSEIVHLIYKQWNPKRNVSLARYSPEYVRDSLIFTDTVINDKGFSLADIHYRVVSLKLLPDVTYAAMAQCLHELPFDTELFVSVQVPDQHKEMETLKTQRRMAFSMASQSSLQVRDLESQNKFEELEAVLEDMVAQGEKIFYFSINIVVRATNERTLEDRVSSVLLKVREMAGAEAMAETYAAFDIFCEMAVPNARGHERRKRVKTSNLADFLPIYGTWSGHQIPRTLFAHPSGQLVSFDPFSTELTNANQLVSGSSGSGKSFLVNSLMLQVLKENPRIYIIDIGGSYQKMTRLLDGQYIPLGLDQGITINPFDLAAGELEPSNHKVKFLLSLVETISREEGSRRLPKLVMAEIEAAIKEVYLLPASQHNLSGLKSILSRHKDPELQKIARILRQWTGDTAFGSFLDRPSTVNLDKRIVCFDLKGLESYPDLQAVCLLLITDLVWREIQTDKQSMKYVVFDECWKLLENEAGATFIAEIFRTFRKYYASAIAISQTMDDFANSSVASAILPNSSVKWILSQKGVKTENLKNILNLNNQEIDCIQGLSQKKGVYSEAFLMAGDQRSLLRIDSTPLEYWICTTDPRDLAAIERLMQEQPSESELQLIEELAGLYPQGIASSEQN